MEKAEIRLQKLWNVHVPEHILHLVFAKHYTKFLYCESGLINQVVSWDYRQYLYMEFEWSKECELSGALIRTL